jgi:hypothetical protein
MLAHFEIVPAFKNSRTDACVDGSCLLAFFGFAFFVSVMISSRGKQRFPSWSTTRVKSAIVVSSMVDGSASPDCRILGRFRPVKMVSKRGAIAYAAAAGKSSGPRTHRSRCRSRAALRPGPSLHVVPSVEQRRAKFHVFTFIHPDGTKARLLRDVFGWAIWGTSVIGREYFVRQAATLLMFAKATTNPQLAAILIGKAADLKSQVDESSTMPDPSPRQAPDVQPEA